MTISQQTLASILGEIVATNVSLEDYMEYYAADFCEWVEGVVIRMSSPAELKHNKLIYYLQQLIEAYFEIKPIGVIIGPPFVMRLPEFPNRRREPDLLVILKTNPHELKATYLDGRQTCALKLSLKTAQNAIMVKNTSNTKKAVFRTTGLSIHCAKSRTFIVWARINTTIFSQSMPREIIQRPCCLAWYYILPSCGKLLFQGRQPLQKR